MLVIVPADDAKATVVPAGITGPRSSVTRIKRETAPPAEQSSAIGLSSAAAIGGFVGLSVDRSRLKNASLPDSTCTTDDRTLKVVDAILGLERKIPLKLESAKL